MLTEQVVTVDYAETYLYPAAPEDLFCVYDAWETLRSQYTPQLCWNTKYQTDIKLPVPRTAQLISRQEDSAEFEVTFWDGTSGKASLALEDGVWKLSDTPYTRYFLETADPDYEREKTEVEPGFDTNVLEARISDQSLVNQVLFLRSKYVMLNWWFLGNSFELGDQDWEDSYNDPQNPGEPYYRIPRFHSMEEIKRSTEQVFTRKYAKSVLYYYADDNHLYQEKNGKLYAKSMDRSFGFWDPKNATILERTENTARLSVIDPLEPALEWIVCMELEDGVWKLTNSYNHNHVDYYFQQKARLLNEALLFCCLTEHIFANERGLQIRCFVNCFLIWVVPKTPFSPSQGSITLRSPDSPFCP